METVEWFINIKILIIILLKKLYFKVTFKFRKSISLFLYYWTFRKINATQYLKIVCVNLNITHFLLTPPSPSYPLPTSYRTKQVSCQYYATKIFKLLASSNGINKLNHGPWTYQEIECCSSKYMKLFLTCQQVY